MLWMLVTVIPWGIIMVVASLRASGTTLWWMAVRWLGWAEAVTARSHEATSDAEFARLRQQLSDVEIAELGFVIAMINGWNLMNLAMRNPVPQAVQ